MVTTQHENPIDRPCAYNQAVLGNSWPENKTKNGGGGRGDKDNRGKRLYTDHYNVPSKSVQYILVYRSESISLCYKIYRPNNSGLCTDYCGARTSTEKMCDTPSILYTGNLAMLYISMYVQ